MQPIENGQSCKYCSLCIFRASYEGLLLVADERPGQQEGELQVCHTFVLSFACSAILLMAQGIGLAVFASACSEPKRPSGVAPKASNPGRPSMDFPFPTDAQVRYDAKNKTVTFLKARNLSESLEQDTHFRELQAANQFSEIALTFIAAYRSRFQLQQPAQELTVQLVTTDDLGLTHIRLQQVFADLPVWSAELNVHLDRSNHVYLIQGRYIPTPSLLSTTPQITPEGAVQRAAAHLSLQSGCPGCRADLLIFPSADANPRLAYGVAVPVSLAEGWNIFVDAENGAILQKIPTVLNTR